MKTIYKSLMMLVVAAMAIGCQQKEFRKVYPAGDPQVEAQLLTTDVQYGRDSIAFSVRVTETQTPLSTLSIKVVAGTNVLANEVVRTPDYAFEGSYRYAVPFGANMAEGKPVKIYLTATNIEGTTKNLILSDCIGHRPAIETMYMMPPKPQSSQYKYLGKGKKMTEDGDSFVAYGLKYPKSIEFLLATMGTKFGRVDWSKPVFGMLDGKLTMISEEQFNAGEATTITLSDDALESIDTIVFNALTFELTYGGKRAEPVSKLDVKNDLAEAPAYITASSVAKLYRGAKIFFAENSEVEITGCTDLSKAYNLDWMEYIGGNKVKFLGKKDMYYVSYDIANDYIVVEPLYELESPDVMYLCGAGMGQPSATPSVTSGWGFDSPNQNFVSRPLSNGVYQFTVYMKNEQSNDYANYGTLNFKFFHQHGWGGEEDGGTYTQDGLSIKGIDSATGITKDGTSGDGSDGNEKGNWIATNEPFEGVYRITLDVTNKTTKYEKLR